MLFRSVKFVYFPFDISNKTELCCEIARQISGVQNWMIEYEIAKFGLESEILSRPFCQLSGGEQTKFLLSILFLKDNAFLLIDEPTNHLDAEARQIVAEYLNMKTGFIIVSHDLSLIHI